MSSSSLLIESKVSIDVSVVDVATGSTTSGVVGGIGSSIRVPQVSQNFESSPLGCLSGHNFILYPFP